MFYNEKNTISKVSFVSIANKIKNELEKQGLKPADLVRLSGVPQGRLSQILSGKTKHPRIDTISKLEVALKVPSGSFQAGDNEYPQDLYKAEKMRFGGGEDKYGSVFDWELLEETLKMIRGIENSLGLRVKEEKIGGLVKYIYQEFETGTVPSRAKVIDLIKLAA